MTQPQFKAGDRVFSHYVMDWGTIKDVSHVVEGPGGTWYHVNFDKGTFEIMNDANGEWHMARIVPPKIAEQYGYGTDPKGA